MSQDVCRARLLYHVPRSQVWEGSRGRQRGHFHIHVTERLVSPPLVRPAGYSLCGKAGWYETDDLDGRPGVTICPTCLKRAERYGVEIPEAPQTSTASSPNPTASAPSTITPAGR